MIFDPLTNDSLDQLRAREIADTERRFASTGHDVSIHVDNDARALILSGCAEELRHRGARALRRTFDQAVATRCLELLAGPEAVASTSPSLALLGGGLRYGVREKPS